MKSVGLRFSIFISYSYQIYLTQDRKQKDIPVLFDMKYGLDSPWLWASFAFLLNIGDTRFQSIDKEVFEIFHPKYYRY